jgi:uncharacterized protein YqgV (UPF0045/DUF77 family)
MPQVRVEFMVEPFVEGQPGAHVLAAWKAVESHGYELATGPFSAEAEMDTVSVDEVVAAVVKAAFSNGAERVSLHIERTAIVSARGEHPAAHEDEAQR